MRHECAYRAPERRSGPPQVGPIVVLLVMMLALGACSSTDETPEYVEQPVEQLYNTAMNNMETENYREAATSFEECGAEFIPRILLGEGRGA